MSVGLIVSQFINQSISNLFALILEYLRLRIKLATSHLAKPNQKHISTRRSLRCVCVIWKMNIRLSYGILIDQ